MLKFLVIDEFVARWKKDDDPNNFGRKIYGPDNIHRVELIETVVGNADRLYVVYPSMLKEEWVKAELDDVMKMRMESGESNHVIVSTFFC